MFERLDRRLQLVHDPRASWSARANGRLSAITKRLSSFAFWAHRADRVASVVLRGLSDIDRPDELRAIGARDPGFIKSEHDPQAIGRRMIARYNDVWRMKHGGQPS